uniref:DUF2059 domain-containing protein n=1 Tax=Pseudoalteromonas translucida (strain TAC 125) TaxID=326442 RepID=A0A6G6AQU4_PSET1|nr:DUF2059 domain-containing protein [Pseudoalteromonas translucida]QID24517.1 DUF2059 domain-containing protein [Pseudoalteromonas translucida TAC125]
MKKLLLIVLLLPFFVNANELVFKLLEVNGAKAFFAQSKGQMAKVMYMTDPSLKPYSGLVEKWEADYFSWEKVKLSIAPIYASKFTNSELEEIVNFYTTGKPDSFLVTNTGKKFQSLLPEINQEFTMNGHKYMSHVSPFLYEAVSNSTKSLKQDK